MPQYMLLIANPHEGLTPAEMEAEHPKWMSYTQALQAAGAMLSGDALQGAETATTVRVRGGETLLTDGPFADTKEVLGGFYIIEVSDLDAALEWAAKIPSVTRGSVEVRPVMVIPDLEDTRATEARASA